MGVRLMLNEEIKLEFAELKKLEIGSDQYKATVDGLTKLVDRAIELEKFDVECQEKAEDRNNDNQFKLKQMEDENKDRWIKNGIAIGGIIIPVGVTIWGTLKSFQFEKDGTITTIMGRGFINKLLLKK